MYKTFEEMGVTFIEGNGCVTCIDHSCHNTVPLRENGEDYNVHISTNNDRNTFLIHATNQANTYSKGDIFKHFTNETDAVKFVCETFSWFKCF